MKILEYQTMIGLADFSGKDVVLDLGCGNGLQTCCLAKRSKRVISIDVADISKAEANGQRVSPELNVEFFQSRLQDASFSNEMFDKIFSFCVIEHIPEYREIMQKCFDLLKPGGEFIISVDSLPGIDPDIKKIHAEKHHVVHYFDETELRKLLFECGFRDINIEGLYCSNYSKKLFERNILDDFSAPLLRTWRQWIALRITEKFSPKPKQGLFLVAHAKKSIK